MQISPPFGPLDPIPNKIIRALTLLIYLQVTVVGDGKVDPVAIAGDKLGNEATLKTLALEQAFPDAIKNTRQHLGKKLFE